jgi:hypothetical protein
MISLTKRELLERILEPPRSRLLTLAIKEDIRSIFPLTIPAKQEKEISIDISPQVQKLVFKALFRVTDLAFDEALDPQVPCEKSGEA